MEYQFARFNVISTHIIIEYVSLALPLLVRSREWDLLVLQLYQVFQNLKIYIQPSYQHGKVFFYVSAQKG